MTAFRKCDGCGAELDPRHVDVVELGIDVYRRCVGRRSGLRARMPAPSAALDFCWSCVEKPIVPAELLRKFGEAVDIDDEEG